LSRRPAGILGPLVRRPYPPSSAGPCVQPRRLGRGDQPGADQRRVLHPAPGPGQVASVALKNPANRPQDPDCSHRGVPLRLPPATLTSRLQADLRRLPGCRGPGARSSRRLFANLTPHAVTNGHRHHSSPGPRRRCLFPRQRKDPDRARSLDACRLQDPRKTGALPSSGVTPRPLPRHKPSPQDGWKGGRTTRSTVPFERADLTVAGATGALIGMRRR